MPADATATGSGLVLRPFRALRYGPAAGSDPGVLTSPPYDVIDPPAVERLLACHPYNVVRLILPRRFTGATGYDDVAERLATWRQQGVLVRDREPALHVYEYTVDGHTVRGLIGALGLRDQTSGVVLPHEDVMPGPVRDRAELIARTGSNLEPILLVYDGDGTASRLADEATTETPLIDTTAPDGSAHRVWAITDRRMLDRIAEDLAPRSALIADGHHRYAAYQRARREAPADAAAVEAHAFGLALVVDQQRYPLALGPIHRVVDGVDLATLARPTSEVAVTVRDFGVDAGAAWADADREQTGRPGGHPGAGVDGGGRAGGAGAGGAGAGGAGGVGDQAAFVCTDGRRWVVLRSRRHRGEIDTHVLHERLLPSWHVSEDRVRYVHDAAEAVHDARTLTESGSSAVALLVRPPSVADVLSAAEHGRMLPRKSTSFGPKPRMGLLMRTLEP